MKRYIVMEIGYIECGVDSVFVGIFNKKEDADKQVELLPTWRNGGQSSPEVFEFEDHA